MNRHFLAPLYAAALSLTVFPAPASAQTLKIFLLTGQSNMQGQAFTFDDPAYSRLNVPTLEFLVSGTPAAATYLANMPFDFKSSLAASWMDARTDAWSVHYNSSDGSTLTVKPTSNSADNFNGSGPLSPGYGFSSNNGSTFGAELAMGIRIADSTTDPVFLFKSAQGGTTLAEDWRPPSAVAARNGTVGSNYTNTVDRFKEFLDALDADLADDGILNAYGNATGYEICGFFWLQGFNESVENSGAFIPEYEANLVDLIHDIRVADDRIPADLPFLVIESSDQNPAMNTGRINAVAKINAEIPGSAAFFESEDMIDGFPGAVFWGNNPDGNPFSTGNGFHYHARAENFLELGWIAGGAVLDNNWLSASDFWLERPLTGSVAFNQAGVSTRANEFADAVTVYWDTVDHGPTSSGWANSASLGSHAAGVAIPANLAASEDTTYFYRFRGTSTALSADFWSASNTFSTPLEFPVPEMADPVRNATYPNGAAVESLLLLADANVTLVWAKADQGATDVPSWTSAPGGGSFSFGAVQRDKITARTITGLDSESTYFFRFLGSNANADDWSAAGTFTTTQNVSGLINLGWDWLHSANNGLGAGENERHDISVFSGAAGYAGSNAAGSATAGAFGDRTVAGYNFFTSGGSSNLISLASGGSSITGTTTDLSFGTNNAADIWTTTDPEGFTSDADFTTGTGTSGISDWSGSIDISGYSAGTIYFIYGSYRGGGGAAKNLDLTMKDAQGVAADIELLDAGSTDQPNNWEHYVVKIGFVNTLGYDTIAYNLVIAGGNGRLGGIVVDGVAISEPTSPFQDWSGSFSGLTDANPSLDFDNGGLDTGIEWVVGGNPADGADDAANSPTFDNQDETYFNFTFKRSDTVAADPNTDIRVEYGSDLTGWRNTTDHGAADGVLIDDSTNLGGGFHQVTVSIPRALAAESKLFSRLRVAVSTTP